MADEEEDYTDYFLKTTNPGYLLIWITVAICILCYVGLAFLIRKRGSIEEVLMRYKRSSAAEIINHIRPPSSSSRPSSAGADQSFNPKTVNQNKTEKGDIRQATSVKKNTFGRHGTQQRMVVQMGRGGKKRYSNALFQTKQYAKVNCRTKAKERTKRPKVKVTVKLPRQHVSSEAPLALEDFTPTYLITQERRRQVRPNPSRNMQKDIAKGLMDDESVETDGTEYSIYSFDEEKSHIMKLAIP